MTVVGAKELTTVREHTLTTRSLQCTPEAPIIITPPIPIRIDVYHALNATSNVL
eukprot:m.410757 g.410757  ORF g.410757 m.410757 type:complete len:54 (-) comp16812_c0_seq3:3597-3758(-)